MRLTGQEVAAIKHHAVAVFGPEVVVRLFGSRTDDTRRGGDIDLHLEVPTGLADWDHEAAYTIRLHDSLGEQRIDVVLQERGAPARPIDRIAVESGVRL